jgi:hypothetical protein
MGPATKWLVRFAGLGALLGAVACVRPAQGTGPAVKGAESASQASPPVPNEIDAATARKLVVAKYHQLFRDKYFLNQADRKYHKLPALTVQDIERAERTDRAWKLAASPPLGLTVFARVDLAGQWVDLELVVFAIE